LDMSYHKWVYYVSVTVVFLLSTCVLATIGRLVGVKQKKYCIADLIVASYAISVIISFANSANPKAAFMGTDGWYMGFVAQIFFVLTYLVFSTQKVNTKVVIGLNFVGSVFCFVVAICQRYGNDFLHLYWDMPAEIVRDYLSTIGNRTWFSAYVCTVCPIGIYLFWQAKSKSQICLFGIYTYIAFACVLVTNCDSAYAGIMAVFYILLLLSVSSTKRLKRFCWLIFLWAGACLHMALLRIPYEQGVRDLRGLSKIFLDIKISTLLLGLSVLLLLAAIKLFNETISIKADKIKKWIYCSTLILVGFIVLLIVLNTTGVLYRYLGIKLNNQYLLFDDVWGDYRGSSWMLTVRMLFRLPLKQMLFGVGPDCFAHYAYSNAEYSQYLNSFWGEAVLANAHNEWLNSIFCMGIFGGVIYIGLFIYIMLRCLRYINGDDPIIPAIGLCIAGYMAHNFFCYQQASATGVIFVFMGIAMYRIKESTESNKQLFLNDKANGRRV